MERYRIVEGVGLYYVTFSVVEWLPVFIDETACKIITDSLNFCIQKKHLGVNAYVIMPTHLHAILFDVEFNPERLKHTLDDMRKFTGRQLLDHAAVHCQSHLQQNSKAMLVKIQRAVFGNRHNMRWGLLHMGFGNRKWITSMTIRVARDWCSVLKTGGFLRRGFG